MNRPPRTPLLTPTGRYPIEPEGLRLADPESPDFIGSYAPPPPYRVRPDMAERYQPGSVTIACACGRVHADPHLPPIDPDGSLMHRLGMKLLNYLRRVAA
jgi:hypothetical protein